MAEAELLKRKQYLTVVEIKENLQTILGSEADMEAALSSLGLSVTTQAQEHQTVKLTSKKLREAVATHVLTEAQAQELAMRTGVIFSMQSQAATVIPKWIASLKAATLAVWKQVQATIVWLATNPAGWFTAGAAALGAAVYGLIKINDSLNISLEEQKEKLQEAGDSYRAATDGLKELGDELQEVLNKIAELEAIPNPSWSDQEELDRLKEITKELKIQEETKKQEKEQASEDLLQENRKTYGKEFASSFGDTVAFTELKKNLSTGKASISQLDLENNITDMASALQFLREEMEGLTDPEEIAEYQSQIDGLIPNLSEYISQNGKEYLASLSSYKENLLDVAASRELTRDEKEFYDQLSSIQKIFYEFYSPSTWNTVAMDSIFNTKDIEITKEELISMAKAGTLDESTIAGYTNLNQALLDSNLILKDGETAASSFVKELYSLADKADNIRDYSPADIFALKNVDGQATALGSISESIGSIQSAWQSLNNAMCEYNENGSLSFDTLQSIVALGDDWLDYLVDENGALKLNSASLKELAESRLEDMRIQAVNNLINNVSRIQNDADANRYLASTNYEAAASFKELAQQTAETARNMLLAQVASGNLSQQSYNAVVAKMEQDIRKLNTLFSQVEFPSPDPSGSSSRETVTSAAQTMEGIREQWKDYLEQYLALYRSELDTGLTDFHIWLNKSRTLLEEYYRDGRIAATDYWDSIRSLYEDQIAIYDKVINAVTRSIDLETDRLQDEKKAIEDSYGLKISGIQGEIDALEKAHKARQEQINLEKLQYELQRQQQLRPHKVYKNGQIVYENDYDAIRSAAQELEEGLYQLEMSRLESQIDSLESEMTQATEKIDTQIKKLEEYKEQWNSVADTYELVQNDIYAQQILGADYESQILEMRMNTINTFRDNYIAAQQAMMAAAWESSNEQIKASLAAQQAQDSSSAGNTNTTNNSGHEKTYAVIQEEGGIILESGLSEEKAIEYISTMNRGLGDDDPQYYFTEDEKLFGINKFASGGHNLEEQIAITSESGEEAILSPGRDAILTPVRSGDSILTPRMTQNLWEFARLNPVQFLPETQAHTLSLPEHSGLENVLARNMPAPIHLEIGDIKLEGIQNADSLAREIAAKFPNRMLQEIYKR